MPKKRRIKPVLSAAKAKKLLKDGESHGKPLTVKQKVFFRKVATGKPILVEVRKKKVMKRTKKRK